MRQFRLPFSKNKLQVFFHGRRPFISFTLVTPLPKQRVQVQPAPPAPPAPVEPDPLEQYYNPENYEKPLPFTPEEHEFMLINIQRWRHWDYCPFCNPKARFSEL